jgi:hypothetical protein
MSLLVALRPQASGPILQISRSAQRILDRRHPIDRQPLVEVRQQFRFSKFGRHKLHSKKPRAALRLLINTNRH